MIDSTNPRILADNIRSLSGETGSQASDISALQTTVTALGSYSITEVDTGMKYGDATIYRKCIALEGLPNNTTINIPHGITNLGTVIDFRGIALATPDFPGRILPTGVVPTLRYTATNVTIQSNTDLSAVPGLIVMEYTKAASPSPDLSPALDDTRSIEPEVREEELEAEPIEEPVVEVKKTTRKKTITTE